MVEECVREIAKSYTTTRFVQLNYEEAEMEVAGVPAILAYKGGDKFAGLVPVVDEIPEDEELSARSLAVVLEKYVNHLRILLALNANHDTDTKSYESTTSIPSLLIPHILDMNNHTHFHYIQSRHPSSPHLQHSSTFRIIMLLAGYSTASHWLWRLGVILSSGRYIIYGTARDILW
jgi:hypothetical protein